MSRCLTLNVVMELLSDAIFGSGFSVPGGEDIAVNTDGTGRPWLQGSAFKGLLRESLENLLTWTGGEEAALDALMGESGWYGTDDGRRLRLTGLTLEDPSTAPEDCFSDRAFTAMEGGTAKKGSLRIARCVRSGLRFRGSLECIEEDEALVRDALRGIKWVGTMRSRGFGRVRFSCCRAKIAAGPAAVAGALCLRYRLRTLSPVLITDLSRSSANSFETQGLIPGAAIRGMVMSELALREPEWFAEHRRMLLGEETRFLDALPAEDGPMIPSLKGFYEDKSGDTFVSVLRNGTLPPGLKRAKLGQFCSLREDTVVWRSTATGRATRIDRGSAEAQTQMFQTHSIDAGQEFEGYVQLSSPELAEKLSFCLTGNVWLGADRYAGFGKCAVTALEEAERPLWRDYSYRDSDTPGETLYLLAISPFTMRDACGDFCGLDLRELAKLLDVDSVEAELCSTSVSEYGGFNRTWGCRENTLRMYDRGSLFKLRCSTAPSRDALERVMDRGLGVRLSEGFGQVLFLRPALFEGLKRKKKTEEAAAARTSGTGAVLRRAKYRWIMDHAELILRSKLSDSQLGSLQAQFEKALARSDRDELEEFLDKNLHDRGAKHGDRFRDMAGFVRETLDRPLAETLGAACQDSLEEKLRLLILLFDHSRKTGRKGDT